MIQPPWEVWHGRSLVCSATMGLTERQARNKVENERRDGRAMVAVQAAIHVWFCHHLGYWKASDFCGDYGISRSKAEAIEVAKDASATGYEGKRIILVHDRNTYRIIRKRITRIDQQGSPQWFQDSVP